ncbi:MAG: 5'-methylthioadenosine/S-adenosylhomocysteine nucleosidase [Candidatus Gallimonas sp.]
MIGAVVAMDSEAEALLSQMKIQSTEIKYGKTVRHGTAFGREVLLVVCGVGKVNAAVGACAAIDCGADVVLNFGVAGGLHADTEVAQVYLIERAVQYDFDLTQLNGGEIGTLDEERENYLPLFTPALPFPRRALASGDRFNDSPEDYRLLRERLGADIRDMEGAAIAQVCKNAGVPFASVKSVSDIYGAGSTTEQFKNNLFRASERLKACMREITEAIEP